MIGRLVGKVIETGEASILLDVSGVGYDVLVPQGTVGKALNSRAELSTDPAGAATVTLSIHTHVRQDSFELFGFASESDRAVFRLLIATPNVGPKMAINILSMLPPAELATAVANEDLGRLRQVSGIGKKKAELILLVLREKLPAVESLQKIPEVTSSRSQDADRLIGALTNMGYRQQQADRAVSALKSRLGKEPLSDLLKAALAELT